LTRHNYRLWAQQLRAVARTTCFQGATAGLKWCSRSLELSRRWLWLLHPAWSVV